jgi:hypothetical protein
MTLNLLPRLRLADFPFLGRGALVEIGAGLESLARVGGSVCVWCGASVSLAGEGNEEEGR